MSKGAAAANDDDDDEEEEDSSDGSLLLETPSMLPVADTIFGLAERSCRPTESGSLEMFVSLSKG